MTELGEAAFTEKQRMWVIDDARAQILRSRARGVSQRATCCGPCVILGGMDAATSVTPGFLAAPTRFLFFTGKGGVGNTSLAASAAIVLADAGRRVLLVSTDAASNLDEMLEVPLSNKPGPVPGATGLSVLNIDPEAAAEAYRQRVLAQMGSGATEAERDTVREELAGACTTEIAAFDEFAALLAGEGRGDAGESAWTTSSSTPHPPVTRCACSACRGRGANFSQAKTAARHAWVRTPD